MQPSRKSAQNILLKKIKRRNTYAAAPVGILLAAIMRWLHENYEIFVRSGWLLASVFW